MTAVGCGSVIIAFDAKGTRAWLSMPHGASPVARSTLAHVWSIHVFCIDHNESVQCLF